MISRGTYLFAIICLLALIVLSMTGCGSNVGIHGDTGGAINCGGCGSTGGGATGGIGSNTNAPVTLTLVDPPTCAVPRGTATHMFLSIAGVQLNPDPNATATSSGWVDVAPSLAVTPKQMDLFNPSPVLGNLVSTTTQVGTFASMRLLLASLSQIPTANQCTSQSPHCLVTNTTTQPIAVSAEATNGIVLNSSAIFGGTIPITSTGQNVNILFDSCGSLIPTVGGFKMLPTVSAWSGAVQTFSVTLTDSVSGVRVGAGNGIVALEKLDSKGVDRIIAQATPDSGGVATIFGPPGVFDLVAVATGTSGGANTMYSPLALTGVGSSVGGNTAVTMALTSQGVADPGVVTVDIATDTSIDTRVSVRQSGTPLGSTTPQSFTIPILGGLSGTVPGTTTVASNCLIVACETNTIEVPSQPLFIQANGATTSTVSPDLLFYTLFAEPFLLNGAGVSDCTSPAFENQFDIAGHLLFPAPGQTIRASGFMFTGCH